MYTFLHLQHTSEGRRPPIPRMSRTRSVDTQTPAADDSSDNGSRSESRSQSVSPTTFPMDGSRPSSRSSSTGNGEVKIEKCKRVIHLQQGFSNFFPGDPNFSIQKYELTKSSERSELVELQRVYQSFGLFWARHTAF